MHFSNVPSDTVLTGRDFFEHHPILSPCNRVYSALFLKGFQFQFTENRFAEDVYDISNIMLHAKRAMRTDQCYYYYRRDNFGSTRNNKELSHKIKLGKDKLFIVFKLNKLREQYEIHGYISHLIIRNILGALCTSNIYKIKEYRNAMILESKKLDIKKIFSKNISLKIIYSMMLIAINKFLLKKD